MLTTLRSLFSSASSALWVGLALAFGGGLSGCYTFQPLVGEDPQFGDEVRLRLSATSAEELSQRTGRAVRSVEGPLLRTSPDSLTVDVWWGAVYAGTPFEGRRDTLSFHRAQILEVDRKDFSRIRTGVLGAAIATALVMIFRSVSGSSSTQDPPDGGELPF